MPTTPTRTWRAPMAAYASASDIGERAKTPMISGIVTGSVIAAAWLVALTLYLLRRTRATHTARAAGYRSRREVLRPPKKPEEAFIIPPDPAVVVEGRVPGVRAAFRDGDEGGEGEGEGYRDEPGGREVRKVRTEPAGHVDVKRAHWWGGKEKEKERGEEKEEEEEEAAPPHRHSAPADIVLARVSPTPPTTPLGPADSLPVPTPSSNRNGNGHGYDDDDDDDDAVRHTASFSDYSEQQPSRR